MELRPTYRKHSSAWLNDLKNGVMSGDKINREQFPETAKFLDWYEAEKAKDLVDVKFFPWNKEGATLESFFGEVNKIIHGKRVEDSDFV